MAGRLRKQLGQGQSALAVPAYIDAQQHIGAAGLEGLAAGLAAHVDHGGGKEQQLAFGGEGLTVLAAEIGQRLHPDFGSAVAVGGQIEAAGDAQAEAEVKGPLQVKAKAAIDVQREAWQVKVQRDVDVGAHQLLAQLHVELDGILGAGGHLSDDPVRELDAVLVEPGHLHVGNGDLVVASAVENDVQAAGTKQVPQRGPHDADRPAFG